MNDAERSPPEATEPEPQPSERGATLEVQEPSLTPNDAAGPDQEAEEAASEPAPVVEAPPLTVEERIAAARSETVRVREQLLRTAADFDNYRKRTRREVEDATRRGREQTIKELLPVFDNLERAAIHVEAATDTRSVADGVRIVLKQFSDTLEKMGIRRVPTVGSPFDPSVHEAIQHLESDEHPAGVVLAEVQAGYSVGEHLLRAAMVVVSKGPPSGESAPS